MAKSRVKGWYNMSYPLFRKRHFEILAAALQRRGGTLTAYDVADIMAAQNKQFNRDRFLEAATYVGLSEPDLSQL